MTNSSNSSGCPSTSFTDVCFMFVIPAVSAVGWFGNVSIASVYLQKKNRRTSVAILIAGLAFCNISYLTAAVLVFTVTPNFSSVGPTLPVTFGMVHTSRTCVVWIYMLLMVDRAVALKHPLHHQVYHTSRRAKIALTILIAFACGFNCTRFLELKGAEYAQMNICGRNITLFRPVLNARIRGNHVYITIYLTYLCSILLYVLPFGVIAVLNSTIYYYLKKHNMGAGKEVKKAARAKSLSRIPSIRRISRPGADSLSIQKEPKEKLSNASSTRTKDGSITVMLFVEALVFLMCNTLPLSLNIMETTLPSWFKEAAYTNKTLNYLLAVNNTLALLNAALTFFVFLVFGSKFRQQFRWTMRILLDRVLCRKVDRCDSYPRSTIPHRTGYTAVPRVNCSAKETLSPQLRSARNSIQTDCNFNRNGVTFNQTSHL